MSTQWYYTENGQQRGPVSAQELRTYADSGRLQPTDLVWREGMANWVEAQKIKGLLPERQALSLSPESAPAQTADTQNNTASPYAPPAMHTQTYGQQGAVPFMGAPVKPANFKLYLGLLLGGLVLLMATSPRTEEGSGLALFIGLAGAVMLVTAAIMGLIYLYRAWYVIRSGHNTRTTPGRAVGFLFIPFFNLYWIFIAYWGWSKDYHAFIEERGLHEAPRVNENLFWPRLFYIFSAGCQY